MCGFSLKAVQDRHSFGPQLTSTVSFQQMNEYMKNHSVLGKIIYWTLCTLLIVALFILVFGVFGVFVIENDISVSRSIGLIIGAVGSIIFILAAYKPLSLISPIFFKKNLTEKYEKHNISILYMMVGFSLLLGGFIYSIANKVEFLILFLCLPSLIALVVKSFRNNKEN